MINKDDESGGTLDRWLGDDPLDVTGSDDQLGRSAFVVAASAVLERVRLQTQSSVVGLIGPWGSGKTTALSEIRKEIELSSDADNRSWIVVEFNPWHYQDLPSLQSGFFRELIASLPIGKQWRGIRDSLVKLGQIIAPLSNLVPGINGQPAIEALTSLISSGDSLSDLQHRVELELRKVGHPILVIIDDLDRLSPDELLLIFKLVRLTGRLSNLYYLIAFDEDTMLNSLTRTGLVGTDAPRRPIDYLEKMIQVRLDLPPARDYQLGKWVDKSLLRLAEMNNIELTESDVDRFRSAYDPHIRRSLTTPRSVKRFFGQASTFLGSVRGEVDFVDFLILTWIRTVEPLVYRLLIKERDFLVGTNLTAARIFSGEGSGKDREFWLRRLADARVAESQIEGVAEILGTLFPRFSAAWGGNEPRLASTPNSARLRAQNPDYFDRYFYFGVPEEDLSDSVVRAALNQIFEKDHGPELRKVETEFLLKPELILNKVESLYELSHSAGYSLLLAWLSDRYIEITPENEPNQIIGPSAQVRGLSQRIFIQLPCNEALNLLKLVWRKPTGGKTLASRWVHAAINAVESHSWGISSPERARASGQLSELSSRVRQAYLKLVEDEFSFFSNVAASEIPSELWSLLWNWNAYDTQTLRKFIHSRLTSEEWELRDLLPRLVSTQQMMGIAHAEVKVGSLDLEFVDQIIGLTFVFTHLQAELDAVTNPPYEEGTVAASVETRRDQAMAQLRAARNRVREDSAEVSDNRAPSPE